MIPFKDKNLIAALTLLVLLAACTRKADQADVAIDRALVLADRLEAERQQHQTEQAQRDKDEAPFNSGFEVKSRGDAERKQLCGDDFGRVAVGWPIKKALTCSGKNFSVRTESANLRIWQGCEYQDSCITLGEQGGRVASWHR